MSWVIDPRKERLRDSALRHLRLAYDQNTSAIDRQHTIEGQARTALGAGHTLGDQIIADMTQAISSCGVARDSIGRAIAEASQVDIMMWVDD